MGGRTLSVRSGCIFGAQGVEFGDDLLVQVQIALTQQARLVELRSDWTPPPLVVELVCRRDEAHGPAVVWLAERFAEHLQAIG